MDVEPVTPTTPRPVPTAVLSQWWRDLTFLHWPADVRRVAALLPDGTIPDTVDGRTYVGLVAFRMDRVGPFAGPGVPYLGRFAETNVRIYSVDRDGRRGVVFRSLDAARLLPAVVGRSVVRLPYAWSRMTIRRTSHRIDYRSRRRWPRPRAVGGDISVAIGAPVAAPSTLDVFLTARWGLHVSWRGQTWYLPNDHPQWTLYDAELLDYHGDLIRAAGLPEPMGAPVSTLYSPGVPVRFGPPQRVGHHSHVRVAGH